MFMQRQAGQIEEDEWIEIVKYMYNEEDSQLLIDKIMDAV